MCTCNKHVLEIIVVCEQQLITFYSISKFITVIIIIIIICMFFFFCCCSKIPPVYLLYRFILIEQNCFLQFGILEFWNLKQTNKKNRIMSIIKEEIFDEQQTTLLSSSSSSTHLYNSNQVSV